MKLKIPQSLYDVVLYYKHQRYEYQIKGQEVLTVTGPYGLYQLDPVPDEEYTTEIIKPVKTYKEEMN